MVSQDFPWLMLPDQQPTNTTNNKYLKSFFSISTHKLHTLQLPEAHDKTICGSSSGWLILLDDQTTSLNLLNPLTRAQLTLPKLSSSKFYQDHKSRVLVHKAILSSDPSRDPYNYKVLAIYGEKRRLIYYKPGEKTWTMLHPAGSFYDDVLSFMGRELLAINELGKLVVCDLDDVYVPRVEVVVCPQFFRGDKVYIVGVGAELVMIISDLQKNRAFEVYRHDEGNWIPINDLTTWTIFLGQNHSAAIDTRKFKGLIKPNCIYFIDDRLDMEDGHDWGVFSLEDHKIEPLQCVSRDVQWPRRVWFMPSLEDNGRVEPLQFIPL